MSSYTVVGAGRSGLAAANLLARRGEDVVLVEAREIERPPALHAAASFQANTNVVRPGDIAVLSPGIPEVSPLRAEIAAVASEVIGEIELFYRLCPAPLMAVTGTDGKSTTTTMLGAIVEEAGATTFVGGNLGNPLCDGLDGLTPHDVVVAEVSCFQLTTCRDFRPRVAVVTNIAEDHVDYHGGFGRYQAAKRRIWAAITSEDTLVLNADDALIGAWTRPTAPTVRTFSTSGDPQADARYLDGDLLVTVDGEERALMARDELSLLGDHNVANALAAALAASSFGIPLRSTARALRRYRPLPHRLERAARIDGVTWINDSKATNPNAAAAGIRAIRTPLVLIAGGSSKDADFSTLGHVIGAHARHVVLNGATRTQIAAAVRDAGHPRPRIDEVETLSEAVELARRVAERGDTVLLAPACASYDQFRSYEHRGDVFKELVAALAR